jgi:hypothetical protein
MTRRTSYTAAVLLLSALSACDSAGPADPEPLPPQLTAAWRAVDVLGAPVPSAMYVFDPVFLDGEEMSVHFVVDSAHLTISPTGRYDHHVWVTEWRGAVGGPPATVFARWHHGDFGAWEQSGTALSFESEWLMNHRMTGSFGQDGVLHMEHGFTHGDPPVALRYGRRSMD